MHSSDFKDLFVWQKAMDLVTEVYKVTSLFPQEEIYGLTSQIRRSAVSVPSNIAEGQGRYNIKDFIHFLHYARGSAAELETQLIISVNVGFANQEDIDPMIQELHNIGTLTYRLINALERKLPHKTKKTQKHNNRKTE